VPPHRRRASPATADRAKAGRAKADPAKADPAKAGRAKAGHTRPPRTQAHRRTRHPGQAPRSCAARTPTLPRPAPAGQARHTRAGHRRVPGNRRRYRREACERWSDDASRRTRCPADAGPHGPAIRCSSSGHSCGWCGADGREVNTSCGTFHGPRYLVRRIAGGAGRCRGGHQVGRSPTIGVIKARSARSARSRVSPSAFSQPLTVSPAASVAALVQAQPRSVSTISCALPSPG
jgi:hypothetical protein